MLDSLNIPSLNDKMKLVNEKIDAILDSDDPFMKDIMNWILANRGKQLRPRLVLLSSSFGTWRDSIIELAASLEVLHMASLVHDDIVDDSPQRRGRESVYKRFGTHAAVYAGDYMVFSILTHLNQLSPARLFHFYRALNKMCKGELTQYENLYNVAQTEENYFKQIEGKTATLFQVACSFGASEGSCDDATINKLSAFGLNFGMMFQIQDDIMDILGSKSMGKPTDSDIQAGIYTLPVIYTIQHTKNPVKFKALLNGYAAKRDPAVYVQILKDITETGGIVYAVDQMLAYKSAAQQAISSLRESDEKAAMVAILDDICGLVTRTL